MSNGLTELEGRRMIVPFAEAIYEAILREITPSPPPSPPKAEAD